jgi:hypothetical protein
MKLIEVMNNLHSIIIDGTTYWFSYETPIAIKQYGENVLVRSNDWGRTTGKHINYIKEQYNAVQIKGETFEKVLAEMF